MGGTNIEIGYGFAEGTDSFAVGLEAARQAAAGIREYSASLVLVFASVRYSLEEMLKGIRHAIEGAPILGTTTAGEICNGVRKGSVVVLVLASPYLKVAAGVGEKVSLDWENAVMQALGAPELMPYFASDISAVHKRLTLEGKQVFGLLFSPGSTRHSDSRSVEILEKLKQLSENSLPLFGGCSADDWRMEANYVLYGETVYQDSLLLAVLETSLEWGMALYHGFTPGPEQVVITRAEGHEAQELNGQPAAEIFAGLLGKPLKALEGKHLTLASGRAVGVPGPYGQYNINLAHFLTPGGGMRMSQPVSRGTALTLMQSEPDNLVAAGREAFRKAMLRGNVENPAAMVVFSGALRQKLFGKRSGEEIANFMRMAPGVPVAGFYSFGEQGLTDEGTNRHNDGVITTLIIGKDLSYAARVASENSILRLQLEQSISNLKMQEKIIGEAEKKYRAIFENAREGIYQITPRGRYLSVNPAMAALYGYASPEEMIAAVRSIGRKTFVVAEKWEELKRRLASKGETDDFEAEQRRRDGSTFWASLGVHAVYGESGKILYWEGRCIDITGRKTAEQALRQSEKRYRTIFENIQDIFYRTDANGNLVEVSPSVQRYSGLSREELIGKSVGEFYVDPEDRVKFFDLIEKEGEVVDYELTLRTRDNRPVHVSVNAHQVYDSEGSPAGTEGLIRDITERKHTEESLRVANKFLESIIEYATEGLCVYHDIEDYPFVRFTVWNKRMQEITGYSMEEINRIGWPRALRCESDVRTRAKKRMARLLEGEVLRDEQWEITRPDGAMRILRVATTILQNLGGGNHVLAFMQDITERRRSEQALSEQHELQRVLLSTIPANVYIKNTDFAYMAANKVFSLWVGVPEHAIPGKTDYDLFPRAIADAFRKTDAEVMATGEARLNYEESGKDAQGNEIWLQTSICPFYGHSGEIAGLVGICIDTTERKRAEQERLQFQQRLQQVQKAESLARMGGAIAHNFNNMLGVVIGNLELAMLDLPLDSEHRSYLTGAMKASDRAVELSRLMLTYLGQDLGTPSPLDLAAVCRDSLPMLKHLVPGNVRLQTKPFDGETIVRADVSRIRQILRNLVLNASEAIGDERGDVTLAVCDMPKDKIAPSPIYPVTWEPADGCYACISIYDTGAGMQRDTLEKIFDPFFSTKFAGRGMGLAVVLGIVTAYEGAISVESSPGQGSVFKVFLPLYREETLPAQHAKPSDGAPGKSRGLILLVEDESQLRTMARRMLEHLKYEVMTAEDGMEALEIFHEQAGRIRCVVLDITMPRLDGWETMAALRALRPEIPIILATGHREADVLQKDRHDKPQAFLFKPYQMKDLQTALDLAVGHDSSRRDPAG